MYYRNVIVPFFVIALTMLLNNIAHSNWITFIPAPLFFSVVAAWCIRPAWPWLLLGAFVMEFFTSLPLGMISLLIITPYLIHTTWWYSEADISLGFFTAVASIHAAQILLLILLHFGMPAIGGGILEWLSQIPWIVLGITWSLTTFLSLTVSIIINNRWPLLNQSTISLEGRRVGGR